MPDLKNFDENEAVRMVRAAEEEAHRSIAATTREALEAIKDISAASCGLPKNSIDLVANATIVRTFIVDTTRNGEQEFDGLDLRMGGYGCYESRHMGEKAPIPPARYRALFFLVKVE